MRCDINVVCLRLCGLGDFAGFVEELGERCIGKVVGESSGMGYSYVDFYGTIEIGLEPVKMVSIFLASPSSDTDLYSWYFCLSKGWSLVGILTHKLPCLQTELVPSIWNLIL